MAQGMVVEHGAGIAVFGATGALGGMVAARSAGRGVRQHLIARDGARASRLDHAQVAEASYMGRSAMVSALEGISTVFFVSGRESPDRLLQHRAAVRAFVEAGVERVVYTSRSVALDALVESAEQVVAETGGGCRDRPTCCAG